LQAAIAACHSEAPTWSETDWPQILVLYDMLLALQPSPVTSLHRSIALSYVRDPATALAELEALTGDLDTYPLFHATRAQFLRALRRPAEAHAADERAAELTANPAQLGVLNERLAR
jgi:RNA polymerase sigma-70 factor (ECF subfamily)